MRLSIPSNIKNLLRKYLKKKRELIEPVIDMLASSIPLDPKYKDHQLKGNLKDF